MTVLLSAQLLYYSLLGLIEHLENPEIFVSNIKPSSWQEQQFEVRKITPRKLYRLEFKSLLRDPRVVMHPLGTKKSHSDGRLTSNLLAIHQFNRLFS